MTAVVGIAAEARDRGCWRKGHITRQMKPVEAVVVRGKNREVHSGLERVVARQKCQAEDGSFGRREDFFLAGK
jgi:hypothetical protein